jgi:hypothetical protein
MKRWPVLGIVIAASLLAGVSGAAEPKVFVTAKGVMASNHRIEVMVGTEVIWSDPHVDRVWFPPASGIRVQRTGEGLSAVFPRPGRYEGRLTMAGTLGTGAADVMPLVVIVKEPVR